MLVTGAIFVAGTSFSFGKSTIQKLTSKEKAEEVQEKVQNISESTPNLGGGLQVHSLGIGIGQTFVKGDFEDNGDDKITWDLLYNYSASHSFDMMANFHYSKHSYKGRYIRLSGLAIGIKGKLYQFDSFSPYAVGGLGFYSPKTKREVNGSLIESESKVVFGTHLGAGGDLKLNNKFTMGLLGQYHNPFDVKQELGPEVEGSYFKLLITALYSF